MAMVAAEDYEARLHRLEEALRKASWRWNAAVGLLAASWLALAMVVLTPAGTWVRSRLPWPVAIRADTVSARQFLVVDEDKTLAGLGLHPPEPINEPEAHAPAGLAALWFYDDSGLYRSIYGWRKDPNGTSTTKRSPYRPTIYVYTWFRGGAGDVVSWL